MLKSFVRNLIVSNIGSLVEDFTAQDIVIDNWNGRIAKENVKFKKDAFRGFLGGLLGAPIEIVQGYAKQLLIEVPWTKIMSKPVEVKIEDVHLILKSRGAYDRQFVKERIIKAKQGKIDELLKQVKESITTGVQQTVQQEASQSYMSRVLAVIEENLRISVRNLHIRFEDTKVSRSDSAFNFGLMAESITYSMTNNRFQRAFLNIDDKIQEQKSFSMLQITKLAMYWNSNAQENWTKNTEFNNLTAQATINFSKRFTENLMRNHFASAQEGQHSNVFIIKPCDISIKFRTNLAPSERPETPTKTTAIEFSDITVSIDEEVYKDIQYLSKFFSWHSESKKKAAFLKYRPPYITSVKGNVQAFWRYAIKATIYMIRKDKTDRALLKRKRHDEMVQLAEILKLEQINTYLKEIGRAKDVLLTLGSSIPSFNGIRSYRSEKKLERRRFHLMYKLTPEQIVVAMTKADKEAQLYIQDYQQKSSLVGKVASMFKWSAVEETKTQVDPSDAEFQRQLDKMVEKSEQLTHITVEKTENRTDDQVASHFSLSIPLIELLFVNKHGSFQTSKCFMQIALQDFFLQSVAYVDGRTQKFYSLRNFQISDKLVVNEKFKKVIFMVPRVVKPPGAKQKTDHSRRSSLDNSMFSLESDSVQTTEIEEEDRPFINNGLPKIRTFANTTKRMSDIFTVFQVETNPQVSRDGVVDKIKIDLFVNQTALFYNRALISQMQTFLHQATTNRVQNASAEDDFQVKKQAMLKEREHQIQVILKRSQFEVGCTLVGVDVLVPDDTNFEQSKFLVLQTGNIVMRSKPSIDKHDSLIDPYFNSVLDKTVQQLSVKCADEGPQQLTQSQLDTVEKLIKPQLSWDNYAIHAFDVRILYVPSAKELETVFFQQMAEKLGHSSDQIDRQYAILRKTDIKTDFSNFHKQAEDSGSIVKACVLISAFELRFTNKEVKELKYFADRFKKYHDELSNQVFQQYVKIIKETQAGTQKVVKVHSVPALVLSSHLSSISGTDLGMYSNRSVANLLSISKSARLGQSTRKRTISNSNFSQGTNDDFQDAKDNYSDARSQHAKTKTVESDESGDEGFFDAQDYFDPEILSVLKLDRDMEAVPVEEVKTEQPKQIAKSNLCFFMQLQVNKITVQILESQDLRSEIAKNIKTAIGQRMSSEDRSKSARWNKLSDDVKTISDSLKQRYNIELKVKLKGAPFLSFELSKLAAAVLRVPSCVNQGAETVLASVAIRDICLTNQQYSQVILRSANHIVEDQVRFSEVDFSEVRNNSIDLSQSEISGKKNLDGNLDRNLEGRLFDLEDEDLIHVDHVDNDDEMPDNFMSVNVLSQETRKVVEAESDDEEADELKVKYSILAARVELGLIEAEVTDFTIKKVIETLVTDFPVSSNRQREETKTEERDPRARFHRDVLVVSDGIHCKLRLQSSEISHLKIIGLRGQATHMFGSKLTTLRLEDFQLLQNENELIFRHNFTTPSSETDLFSPRLKPKQVNFFETTKFDFQGLAPDKPQLLTVDIEELQSSMTVSCQLINLLVIIDLQSVIKIVSNVTGLLLALGPFKPKSNSPQPDPRPNLGLTPDVSFSIIGFHLQIPVSRDSKNSLFVGLDDMTFEKKRDESGDFRTVVACHGFGVFVAKQIDQCFKYFLLQIIDVDVKAQLPGDEPSIPKEVMVSVGKVTLNLNDNFLLLLASMLEHHLQHVVSIQSAFQNLAGLVKGNPQPSKMSVVVEETKKITMSRKTLRQFAKTSPFLKSVIAQEKVIDTGLNIRTYARAMVSCVQVQWIFEMSFDDHDENFQTLNNRNFSKQILSRLQTKQETLILPQFAYELEEPKVKPEPKMLPKKVHSSFENYKRLSFTLYSVLAESAQNLGKEVNSYFNFTVNTAILDHHRTEFSSASKHHAGTVYISQHDTSIISEYPILLFRSSSNDAAAPLSSTDPNRGNDRSFGHSQTQSLGDAITLASAFSKLQGTVSLVDVRMCQLNVKVVAKIVTSVYSCKNLLQHGQKRHLIKSFLGTSERKAKVDFALAVKKVRLMCFDSQMQSETRSGSKPKSVQHEIIQRTIQDFDGDQVQFKPHSVIIAECAFSVNNQRLQTEEDSELQADSSLNFKASSVEVYMNSARTNLIDLMSPGSENRAIILYPCDIVLESQFFNNRCLRINDVQVSMVEFETSFRQLFNLSILGSKIASEFDPIKQIFQRISTVSDAGKQGQQRGKSKSKRSSMKRTVEKSDQAANFEAYDSTKQRGVMILAVKVQSVYFALIREAGFLPLAGSKSLPLLPNEMSCLPLLSLEIKWVRVESKQQVTGIQQTNIQLPFELYYFNQKLAFFEPAIEKVLLKASIDSDLGGNTEQRLMVENVLNVNFSVALYESLFLLNENFQEEKTTYEKAIKQESEPYLSDLGPRQKTAAFDQLVYSTSTFFIQNKTGEILLFKAGKQPAYTEMQTNETLPLDFNSQPNEEPAVIADDNGSKGFFDGVASSDMQPSSEFVSNMPSEEDDEETTEQELDHDPATFEDQRIFKVQKTRSIYRRGKFRLKKSEPNIVLLQVLIQNGKEVTRTERFEINFNLLSCQRVFLDETRRLYVICQIQNKDGQKILVVRSPMQVTNNLQIPVEVQLCIPSKEKEDEAEPVQEDRPFHPRYFAHPLLGIEAIQMQDRLNEGFPFQQQPKPEIAVRFSMVIKPESSLIIPLKACSFESVKIRPLVPEQMQSKDTSMFAWSEEAPICLLQDESEIFETKPVILSSSLAVKHDGYQQPRSKESHVFFAVNANTYSIRSFIDFNTQKTEFISLRYLSITSPFVFQNLIPVPITILFKNVRTAYQSNQEEAPNEPSVFDLTLKHNSSLQVLFLDSTGNFDFSLAIPGYEHSKYSRFKLDQDVQPGSFDDGHVKLKSKRKDDSDSDGENNQEMQLLASKTPFRFLTQRKLLFEMHSQFQNQFNICCNIALIQGFYQITFFAKFWLLNNTQMPLQFKVTRGRQAFAPLDLPFESTEFDFETSKHFAQEVAGKDVKRKDSGETVRENRTELDTISEYPTTEKESVGYIRRQFGNPEEKRTQDQEILLRLKPWETYRAQGRDSDGLLAALTQEDISRVSSIYFTQEMAAEESKEEPETPSKMFIRPLPSDRSTVKRDQAELLTQRSLAKGEIIESARKRTVQFQEGSGVIEGSLGSSQMQAFNHGLLRSSLAESLRVDKFDRLTKTSKTSIQFQNLGNNPDAKFATPLNSVKVSKFELYEAPLQDKDQLKRVILFSDSEESLTESQMQQQLLTQSEMGEQGNFLLGASQTQDLRLKVCDSEWATIPFDLARLHTGPIQIIDRQHSPGDTRPRAMFELVAVVTFLPSPFSFSKLICFQPRYLMVNRTFQTIQVVQYNSEELGTFKIFPQETSVFHWTDYNRQQQISVKMSEYEFSGSIDIDKIGEWNLRLKSTYGLADNIILNVSISEEANSLYIVFTDISHAPPYRIENLTKSKFNIAQVGCRQDDFDRLEPYSTRSFAWSCPLQKKEIKLQLSRLQSDEDLGTFYIDSIQEREVIKIRDKERRKQFLLEITSEKTMKVLRIMYPHMLSIEKEAEKVNSELSFTSQKIIIERLGISIINSQARELSYTTISNLRFSHESTIKHQKLSLRVGDVQMDNQTSRQYDSIIFKRQERDRNRGDFLCLKFNLEKNLTIENLIVFKYIIIAVVPFNIMIDGTFCDEVFLYCKDVGQLVQRYSKRKKHLEWQAGIGENLMEAKKAKWTEEKGQPIVEQRDMQKIFIENFLIGEINFSFTFSRRPVVFREFTMPPLLKFLLGILSGMSRVQIAFSKYHVQHEHMLVSIFVARLNQFYKNEFLNHKQLLNLFSQMGIFGHVYGTVATVWHALKSIVYSPLAEKPDEENIVKALFLDSFVFVKDYITQLSGTVFTSVHSLKSGMAYIASHYTQSDEQEGEIIIEDDLNQLQRNLSPFGAIETQNQLWLKVIIREIRNTERKKLYLRKQSDVEEKKTSQQRRVLDVRDKAVTTVSNLTTIATSAAQKVASLPTKLKQAYSGVVTTFITGELHKNGQLQKVRPPRFVGFTMELEPYSKKKAFVLQILNDINLKVYEAESIQKMYSLNNHTVIITGKRIICVNEQRCIAKDPNTGLGLFAKVRSKKGDVFTGNIVYRHWNILFKDIYRVSLDMVNRETGKILSRHELERVFAEHSSESHSQSQQPSVTLFDGKLSFVLRIHYQMEIDEEFLMFDDGTVSAAPTLNERENPDLMASVHGGMRGFQSLFKERKKNNYELLHPKQERASKGVGLVDGLSGLMVGRKDIQAKIKEFKTIKRISRDVEEKLALDRIKRAEKSHDDSINQV